MASANLTIASSRGRSGKTLEAQALPGHDTIFQFILNSVILSRAGLYALAIALFALETFSGSICERSIGSSPAIAILAVLLSKASPMPS